MKETPHWFNRQIIRPANERERDVVRHVQLVLRCPVTGEMDEATVSHIRGVQHVFDLKPTGCIDEATAEQIERLVPYDAVHVRQAT